MDLETFVRLLLGFVNNCSDLCIVLYAVADCVLTLIIKKLFVNKVKVDVLHKFDLTTVLPFVFGVGFAVLDLAINNLLELSAEGCTRALVDGATIGALATVTMRFVSSLSGRNLNNLLKDDVFVVFYTQILYFGNTREQLLDKTLSLKDYIKEIKLIVSCAKQIYGEDDSADEKRNKLAELLSGVVEDSSLGSCVSIIDDTLARITGETPDKTKTD